MLGTITNFLANVADSSSRLALGTILRALGDRHTSRMLNTPGLVIKAGGSALVKTGASDCYAVAQGVLVKIAAATDMAALSGTVTNAKFNVYVYLIDREGTKTSAMGVEGATLATMKWPPIPEGKAVIGFTIINPTGTGNFVGGTTALDDVTVVPNAVHVSLDSGFDPSLLP